MDWYFPTTIEEAACLLAEDGHIPHSGGTAILRRGFSGITGLVDLSGVPMKKIWEDNDHIYLGAGLTFSEAVEKLKPLWQDCILVSSLSRAASTPLRNRITLGGSIAAFPIWSDLMGPLAALGAKLELFGKGPEIIPLSEYLNDRGVIQGKVITGIFVPRTGYKSWYYRYTRVSFDYPLLNISMVMDLREGIISDPAIFITGTTKKTERLGDLEERLTGRSLFSGDIHIPGDIPGISFPNRKGVSSGYLSRHAAVMLERGLSYIGRES